MRLAFDVLCKNIPWAIYYIRHGYGLALVSVYGIQGKPPQIREEDLLKALDAGSIDYLGTRAEIFEPCTNHIIMHPEIIELPARVHEEITRIASLSIYKPFQAALYIPEGFKEDKFLEYLKTGIVRNFSYASLFVMNLSALVSGAQNLCVHTTETSLVEELAAFTCNITGSIRNVFVLPGKRLLCAVMTHKQGDPELIATLVSKTLLRLIARTHAEKIQLSAFSSVKLSNDGLESTLRSFINEL